MPSDSDGINRRGVHIAGAAFEALGFAFREQETSDFGIDAQLELRTGSRGTGEIIALQVKSGKSYFREPNCDGWWLRTDHQHIEYWLGHSLPVIVVQVDVEEERVFWEVVTSRTVYVTEAGAKILIPRGQPVDLASLPALRRLLSPIRDLGQPAAEGNDCRVYLGRGISGRTGWHAFAEIVISQLEEMVCIVGWDIIVEMRTALEDEKLTETNEYGDLEEGLTYIDLEADRRLARYSVSSQEVDDMDMFWNVEFRAESGADLIVQHLMAAEGLLDDEDGESLA